MVKKTLMRTPINGARLTSRFGRRKHPILGYTKLHKGIDFAAPIGTRVFAAGNGIITKIGWNGTRTKGYGKYIRIKHNKKYSTAYAHLYRFKKGLKVGSRVKQGQVIGYVGTTGGSTGPHLHYEILKKGRQINPLTATISYPTNVLKGKKLREFQTNVKEIDKTINDYIEKNNTNDNIDFFDQIDNNINTNNEE
jgi:murein DD-endopeptidase MepM/ murein hydrolase activator NlpD